MKGRKANPVSSLSERTRNKDKDMMEARENVEKRLRTENNLTCPRTLSPEAQKEWRRVMRLYRKMDAKILNDLDIPALSMYCEAVAQWKEAQSQWAKLGKLISSDPKTQKVLDKIRTIMNDQTKVITSLAEQLCLSPVGRARFGIGIANKTKEEQELEGLKELMSGD